MSLKNLLVRGILLRGDVASDALRQRSLVSWIVSFDLYYGGLQGFWEDRN